MKLDDLKVGWKATVEKTVMKDNLAEVIETLKNETSKLDKSIKRRDFLEISIAILLIPVWTWKLFYSDGLIQLTGLWIAILACIYIPYKMIKAKQVDAAKDSSVLAFLAVEKIKLEKQKKLLESIAFWYITPLMLAIFLITFGATVDEFGIPHLTEQLVIYYFFCGLLTVGVYWLNKRAAKKQFTPLLEKVNLRIKELNELNNESNQ